MPTKNIKYHYVYRIINKKLNKYYYGSRSSNLIPELDIGCVYFSSSTDKAFIADQKANPTDYRYKVISVHNNRNAAINNEIKLHTRFDVGVNESFYNKAKQTSSGFIVDSTIHAKSVLTRNKSGNYKISGKKASATWKNKSEEEKEIISQKFKDAFSKLDMKQRARKAVETKKNTIDENGNSLLTKIAQKGKETCLKNGYYDKLAILQTKRMQEMQENGKTQAQNNRANQHKNQLEDIDVTGFNAAQRAAFKYHENLKNTIDVKTGLTKAELRIQRQKETIKKKGLHKGSKNSSFGTKWIFNENLKKTKRVKKEEIQHYLGNGWNLGQKREFINKR
jgi:hypothetical protein